MLHESQTNSNLNISVPALLDALWHLLIRGAVHDDPIVHVSGVQSAGGDAGCAVGVLEGQVAQRTHERCLAGTSLSHYEEAGASPQNRTFRLLYSEPFFLYEWDIG